MQQSSRYTPLFFVYNSMKVLLFFLVAVHVYACDEFDKPMLKRSDIPKIEHMVSDLKRLAVNKLEVKYITKYDRPDISGAVFDVDDSSFWFTLVEFFNSGDRGELIQNCELEELVLDILPQATKSEIYGIGMLCNRQIRCFFPGYSAIQWCVGPTDWILLNKAPGSVTLRPVGYNYALHFVPNGFKKVTPPTQRFCDHKELFERFQETQETLLQTVNRHEQHIEYLCSENSFLKGEVAKLKNQATGAVIDGEPYCTQTTQKGRESSDDEEVLRPQAWREVLSGLVCCFCARE